MRAVFVDADAFFFFAIDIATDMGTALQHEHALSRAVCLVGKDRTKEAAADDEKIVHEYPS